MESARDCQIGTRPDASQAAERHSVSIIIPVKEINGYVIESYSHLRKLEYASFEVIVFPDKDCGVALKGARIIATGPMGPAEKRDLAIRYAHGEVLAFLDDDAFPRPDWLSKALRHFDDPFVAAVGGPGVTPCSDSVLQKGSGAVFASRLTSSAYTYRYLPERPREVDDFPTVNLLVRKSVFERLGGFDTAYWPGEDTKLCRDIRMLGLRIVYEPDAVVYHHRRPLFAEHLRQVARYAFQRGHFARAFPENSMKPGYFVPSAFVLFVLSGPGAWLSEALFLPWAAILALYAALLLAAAARAAATNRSVAVGAVVAPGIFLTHLVYGFNFMRGLAATKRGAVACAGEAEA